MRMVLRSASAAVLFTLTACSAPPIATNRAVATDPAQVRRAIEAELTALGFTVTGAEPTMIEATAGSVPPAWASCPPILVGDGDDRRRMASAGRREAVVHVAIDSGPAGSQVTVAASFTAAYRNTFNGYGTERACRSQGVVESRLLAAATA